jgi:hypothetical protein
MYCTYRFPQLLSYIYNAPLNIIIATSSLLQPIEHHEEDDDFRDKFPAWRPLI